MAAKRRLEGTEAAGVTLLLASDGGGGGRPRWPLRLRPNERGAMAGEARWKEKSDWGTWAPVEAPAAVGVADEEEVPSDDIDMAESAEPAVVCSGSGPVKL